MDRKVHHLTIASRQDRYLELGEEHTRWRGPGPAKAHPCLLILAADEVMRVRARRYLVEEPGVTRAFGNGNRQERRLRLPGTATTGAIRRRRSGKGAWPSVR